MAATWSFQHGAQAGQAPIIPRAQVETATQSDVHDHGDDEATNGRRGQTTAMHLQQEFCSLRDRSRLRNLEHDLASQGNWPQLDRLKDLRHAGMSNKWLCHLDTRCGSVLAAPDFIINVQKRLGAASHASALMCRLCGVQLDPQLEHSETCSAAEATKGHYACVRALLSGIRLADPSATTEPRGLTSSTSRPADILTQAAVPGRSAALDVCVASPNSAAAMGDAADSAFRRKLHRYRSEIQELRRAGIVFRPMVWTSDGRPHPAVTRTLKFASELASRRHAEQDTASALMGRWRHEIQIAILRRRAAMCRAVLPKATAFEHWLRTGIADRGQPAQRCEAITEEEP